MRIIAGSARGRRFAAPEGLGTRPITDRAKEAIFNMVHSLGGVENAIVLDLFAGSGSFGLECLSRGARHVTFVERDARARRTLEANLAALGFTDRATVIGAPVERVLPGLGRADIAFCDPPYALDAWPELLEHLEVDLLVGHAEHAIELTDRWHEERRRRYGRSQIVIASPADSLERSGG